MKIHKPTHKKRILAIVATLVVALLASLWVWQNGWHQTNTADSPTKKSAPQKTVNFSPPTQEEIQQGASQKQAIANAAKASPTPQPKTVNVTITAVSENSGTLQIRTLIDAITSTGTCALHMTNGSKVYDTSTGIQALASYSTCAGFNIPTSQLSSGSWTVMITVNTGQQQGSATRSGVVVSS